VSGGVVVTGASSGIGRACALDLERRGFRVFATVRGQEDADALATARIAPLLVDVTDADAVARLHETVDRELGSEPLAGVVNNAGIGVGGPIEAIAIDELRRQFEVNTFAPVAVTQGFIPRLRESRGRIVNMSSVGGRVAQPFLAPYSGSKFALEAISDAMRRELLPWGVHVALVEPGNVKTRIWEKGERQVDDILAGMTEEQLALYRRNVEQARRLVHFAERTGAKPERVARAVAHALTAQRPRTRYLVGPDARMQVLVDRMLPTRLVDRLLARVTGS
jgi:NAD(P)-dependent dehydrogenase (short-subunit alcohol dehydrogenase family)